MCHDLYVKKIHWVTLQLIAKKVYQLHLIQIWHLFSTIIFPQKTSNYFSQFQAALTFRIVILFQVFTDVRFTAGGWEERTFGSHLTFLDLVSEMKKAIWTILRRKTGNEGLRCVGQSLSLPTWTFMAELLSPGFKGTWPVTHRPSYGYKDTA